MVPPASNGISRVPPYSGYCSLFSLVAYGTLTLFGVLSHTLQLKVQNAKCSPQPQKYFYSWFVLLRVRSPLLAQSRVDFFSSPYLDVSVQAVPHIYLFYSVYVTWTLLHVSFLIQTSADQRLFASPRSFSQLITSFIGS